MKLVIYIFNFIVLLSTLIDLRIKEPERRLSLALVRIFFIIPSLIATYLVAYFYTEDYIHPYFFNTENIFSLLWMVLAFGFYNVISSKKKNFAALQVLFVVGASVAVMICGYSYFKPSPVRIIDTTLVFSSGSVIYCSALLLVSATLLLGWRLEAFWRSLDADNKWRYKYLLAGLWLVCAVLGGSCSYRLAYLRMPRDHFLLLAVVLGVAWTAITFALARHRLLNRKLFISRKVVYATITPIAFSSFFFAFGLMSLLSRIFGWTVPVALQRMIILTGLLTIVVFALSGRMRKRVKYFISTHFYVNKYEYRDEWLAFSDLLLGKLTEKGVVEALYQILRDSLYTNNILIWLGDIRRGFRLVDKSDGQGQNRDEIIAGDDAIACYLHNAPYLYSQEGDDDPLRRSILKDREDFLTTHDIVLMVPLIMGSQCVGLIGLGPETTGGRYGHDDFDLLAALSSHAASALLAIQNAEKLARTREQSAWSNMSAFVLHDIKNAATMLDLVRKNAGEHMNDPEFQKDMLESIDDALKRIAKVQDRLSALKGKVDPATRTVDLGGLLRSCVGNLSKKLPELALVLDCPLDICLQTDTGFFCQILENLLINAFEAGGDGTKVRIDVRADSMIRIDLRDDGPGIQADLLPQALFEPFKTAKSNGSGIGLWQVRELVESLGGEIQAQNMPGGGAQFTLLFPYRTEPRLSAGIKV